MTRIENDHYPTPNWMTGCLIKHGDIQGSIFEPCAGEALAIGKCFPEQKVITNDNNRNYKNCDYNLDVINHRNWWTLSAIDGHVADWVITNPPFNCQQPIIKYANNFARVGVAMLLRVTADEMVVSAAERDRASWWVLNAEDLQIKMPRFSFAKSSKSGKWQTDSAYCQWVVWRKDGHKYDQPIIRIPHWDIPDFTRKPIEEQS